MSISKEPSLIKDASKAVVEDTSLRGDRAQSNKSNATHNETPLGEQYQLTAREVSCAGLIVRLLFKGTKMIEEIDELKRQLEARKNDGNMSRATVCCQRHLLINTSLPKNKWEQLFGSFVFGRSRSENPNIPDDTVTVLNYPFKPTAIPCEEKGDVFRDALASAKVYLIGAAHYSLESQQDVLRTIANTQPDVVMVELCRSHISILYTGNEPLLREARNLDILKVITTIKENGVVQGLLLVLLQSISAHVTRRLGMAPGGELRAAHRGAAKLKLCKVVLGDRPLHITLQRALGSLGFFQKLRLFCHILSHWSSITQGAIERYKESDILVELFKEVAAKYPDLSRIVLEERDLYMTRVLHALLLNVTLCKRVTWKRGDGPCPWEPVTVVAVVGIGHVPGIVANWKKGINVTQLLSIPPPSRSYCSAAFRFALKGLLIGVTAYGLYRLFVKAKVAFR